MTGWGISHRLSADDHYTVPQNKLFVSGDVLPEDNADEPTDESKDTHDSVHMKPLRRPCK